MFPAKSIVISDYPVTVTDPEVMTGGGVSGQRLRLLEQVGWRLTGGRLFMGVRAVSAPPIMALVKLLFRVK